MAVPVEENVLNALRGHINDNIKLPAPLIIKIYVSSSKKGLYYLYNVPTYYIQLLYSMLFCISFPHPH